MTAELLDRARAAGLTVLADGDRLIVRGPQTAEALAHELLTHKTEILAILHNPAIDYAQAVQEARAQRAAWSGATLELAEALGFPRLQYEPHLAVGAGEACWRFFLGSASSDIPTLRDRVLPALREALGAIPVPEAS